MTAAVDVGVLCDGCEEYIYPDDNAEYVCENCDQDVGRVDGCVITVFRNRDDQYPSLPDECRYCGAQSNLRSLTAEEADWVRHTCDNCNRSWVEDGGFAVSIVDRICNPLRAKGWL